jgi:D-alanine-D-alanine ligase
MLVGITYDLRSAYLAQGYGEEETAEFDRDDTIEAIDAALQSLGHQTVRIGNIRDLVSRLAAGESWDLVFNICEGLRGAGRESQVPALLEAYNIPVTFSDSSLMALCLNKAWTKAVLGDAVPTPDYLTITSVDQLANIELRLPLFMKPLSEGTGKGVTSKSVIRDLTLLRSQCEYLLHTYQQPVLVETYLPGREFTVSILGTGQDAAVLGTFEIILLANAEAEVYGYLNKEESEARVQNLLVDPMSDPIVAKAEARALTAWRLLGCRDAGRIDMRCDDLGEPSFVEVNPLAGINPGHSDLPMLATAIGMEYVELIRLIVESAATRIYLSADQSVQQVA